jgi:hypothetical protein
MSLWFSSKRITICNLLKALVQYSIIVFDLLNPEIRLKNCSSTKTLQ